MKSTYYKISTGKEYRQSYFTSSIYTCLIYFESIMLEPIVFKNSERDFCFLMYWLQNVWRVFCFLMYWLHNVWRVSWCLTTERLHLCGKVWPIWCLRMCKRSLQNTVSYLREYLLWTPWLQLKYSKWKSVLIRAIERTFGKSFCHKISVLK